MAKPAQRKKPTQQLDPRDVVVTWDVKKKKWLADGKVIPSHDSDPLSGRRVVLGHGLLKARAERLRHMLGKQHGTWALAGWAVAVVPMKHPLYPEMLNFPILDVRMEVYLVNCEEAQPGTIVTFSESLLHDDVPTNVGTEQLALAAGKTPVVSKKGKKQRPTRRMR